MNIHLGPTSAISKKLRCHNTVLISLSGGVDSMVISKILTLLQAKSKQVQIDHILAIHIDYANRPESGSEADYIREWCNQLGIAVNVRVINEVTRGITDRDAYEKISRTIRYSTYEDCIASTLTAEYHRTSSQKETKEEGVVDVEGDEVVYQVSGVIFGHHLGDVQENVISNVMR
jgi:tRNA(Ile)-lysidine synthase TilS/MesJ